MIALKTITYVGTKFRIDMGIKLKVTCQVHGQKTDCPKKKERLSQLNNSLEYSEAVGSMLHRGKKGDTFSNNQK